MVMFFSQTIHIFLADGTFSSSFASNLIFYLVQNNSQNYFSRYISENSPSARIPVPVIKFIS
jgi:hypothetical protein